MRPRKATSPNSQPERKITDDFYLYTSLPARIFDGEKMIPARIIAIGDDGAIIEMDNLQPKPDQILSIDFRMDMYAEWARLKARVASADCRLKENCDQSYTATVNWAKDSGFDPRWLWFLRYPYVPES